MIWVCSLGVTLKPAMGNDYLNLFPRSSTMVIHFTSLWDVKLLVRMLEKEDGFVGSTLKKKNNKTQTAYFRGGLDVRISLEGCLFLASLSSARFPLCSQPFGYWFSLSSRRINLSCVFPEVQGGGGREVTRVPDTRFNALTVRSHFPPAAPREAKVEVGVCLSLVPARMDPLRVGLVFLTE